jgi:hypothetical protein
MKQVWIHYLNETEEQLEYVIKERQDKDGLDVVELARAGQNWSWECIGEIAAKCKDDGNEVIINIDNKKITLDYAQVEALLVLLTYNMKARFSIKEVKDLITVNTKE